jgi:ABC-type Zn uptake system ZnuABC Zn-binding protein ZnuA
VLLLTLAVLAGCTSTEDSGGDAALRVVATTTQAADFARQVGGDRVAVTALLGAGADPHDFEPKPSDARAVAQADVVLRSGGDLDAWLGDVVDGAGGDARVVTLIDEVERRADDPHWWQDPRNVVRAVAAIRDAFVAADAAGEQAYVDGAARYADEVRRLDAAIAQCFADLPAARRKLVTNHDSFRYFAARYDIEVLGSIVPALSSSAQASAGDVRRLVAAIRREGVRTIFPESALSQRLEEAVARDSGAQVGPALLADTLGEPGTAGGTYLGALRHDASAIAKGLGGSCELPAAP